jgi:hypothetical protein
MKRFYLAGTSVLAAVAILVLTPYVVSAALEVFTGEALFREAVGDTVYTEDFEDAPLGTVLGNETPTFGELRFSYDGVPDKSRGDPTDGQPLIRDAGLVNNTREFMGEVNADGSPSGNHTFTFQSPVVAFGGKFFSTLTGAKLTVSVGGKTVRFSDFLSTPGDGFFGFTSSTGFSAVEFGTELPANATLRDVLGRLQCSLAESPLLSASGGQAPSCSNKVASSEVFHLDDVVYTYEAASKF